MTSNTSKSEYPDDFYTSLEDAKIEIERRWNDEKLKSKVEDVLEFLLFDQLKTSPRAFLSRDIITPDLEFEHFLELARDINLKPFFLEYSEDKFVARNDDKYYLCNMHFFNPQGKKGQEISHVRAVDFNKWEGKKFCEVETLKGEKLVDFHHNLLSHFYPDQKQNVVEFSAWFNSNRFALDFYYLYFFSLFICHGVLFENFLTEDKEELKFTLEKVIPSFNKVKELYGVKPLIVPLEPLDHEIDKYWWCFPQKEKKIVEDMLK